jgi:hypothetical protein
MPNYQPNIPTGSVPFDLDYLNLLANFQQLDLAYGIDHIAFSDTSGVPPVGISGLHKKVTMPQSGAPGCQANQLVIFTGRLPSTNSALFYQRDSGGVIEVTGPYDPVPLTNNYSPMSGGGPVGTAYSAGYTVMIGGVIYQYGSYQVSSISPSTGTVKFPATFLNGASVVVNITPICKSGGATINNTFSVQSATVSATQFQWNAQTSTSEYTGFYWTAIGN